MSIFVDQELDQDLDTDTQYKYYSPIIKLLYIYLHKFINNLPFITTQIIKYIDDNKFKTSTTQFDSTYTHAHAHKVKYKYKYKKEIINMFLYYYIKSFIVITNTITTIKKYTYGSVIKYIPEHTIQIISFNTKTNKIQKLIPLLYLFKYYRIPRRLHEVYYSITVWSKYDNCYKSIFIDALILSELENNTNYTNNPNNPYTISNILGLIKYANLVKCVNITSDNDISYYLDTNDQTNKLFPYFHSLTIPNNITVDALNLLYLYLGNYPVTNAHNAHVTIKLIHSSDYTTTFTGKNSVIFSSLDINVVD